MRGPIIDRYEIVGELGQGGMSVVYRARDRQLSREVAVKVLHEFLARQPDARKRLHREAVAVAKLHHPGILEIFDYSGPEAEQSYIVTELIDGVTLRDFVEQHGAPRFPELAVLIIAELVRALRHAHEQSVIHRDLKPENVMITRDGALKLMDFGLAQLVDGGTRLTATGTLLGSPAHMAPEVIDGKASDARADIFSMGTILYWLATGRLPFEAPNPSALFKRILDGAYENPQVLQPRIGNGLSRVIARALAPRVEERYQDITELHADLITELELVGIAPLDAAAREYLKDPIGFTRKLEPKLVESLVANGRAALEAGNVGRAIDRFNRVLAIDPEHAEVKRLVARLGRRQRFARIAKRAVAVIGIAGGLGAIAWAATTVERAKDLAAEREAAARATMTVLSAGPTKAEARETSLAPAPVPASAPAPAPAPAPAVATKAEEPAKPTAPAAPSVGRKEKLSGAGRSPGGAALPSSPSAAAGAPSSSAGRSPGRAALPSSPSAAAGAPSSGADRSPGRAALPSSPSAAAGAPSTSAGRSPGRATLPSSPSAAAGAPSSGAGAQIADGHAPAIEGPSAPPPIKLKVLIGHGIATHVLIDGKSFELNGYAGSFDVAPGRHRVAVKNDLGVGAPVPIEVRADGKIFAAGASRPIAEEGIKIAVPASKEEAKTFPGWLP